MSSRRTKKKIFILYLSRMDLSELKIVNISKSMAMGNGTIISRFLKFFNFKFILNFNHMDTQPIGMVPIFFYINESKGHGQLSFYKNIFQNHEF